ncbi:MAG: recombinase family protein [Paraclostridium sp.]
MNKVFNYIRVSSKEQNEQRQVEAMKKWNKDNGVVSAIELVDKATGTNNHRDSLQLLLKVVGEGDLVVVKSIDRLSRSYKDVIELWNTITGKGADIVVIDMPLLDTRQHKDLLGDFISNLILQVLSYVAQQETEFRKQRQLEGIALAKAEGKHLGRPQAEYPSNWKEVYTSWKNKEITAKVAMDQLGLKRTTFYKLVKLYDDKQDFTNNMNKHANIEVKSIKDMNKKELQDRIKLRSKLIKEQSISKDSIIYKDYEQMNQILKELE